MKITFQTKEESNTAQRQAFLALTPVERFYQFLFLMEKSNRLISNNKKNKNKSFEIVIKV